MYIFHTKLLLFAIIFATALQESKKFPAQAYEIPANNQSIWNEVGRLAKFIFGKCLIKDMKGHNQLHRKDNAAAILEDCLKRRGLRALDRALSRNIIEITDNVVIVKWKNDTEFEERNGSTKKLKTAKSLQKISDWSRQLMEKISYFLKTRVLRITFKEPNSSTITSRGRHRDKNGSFGQMMLFGLVAAGFIVIPLGFQFLAVLGGKALLLAKLALLLSSIQGLKKIATSSVNYGLYSTGHADPCKILFDCEQLLGDGGYGGLTDLYTVEGDGYDDDVHVAIDIDADASIEPSIQWHYDRQWHYETDHHYPSSYYSSPLSSSVGDHYIHSSVVEPIYSSAHPRVETYS